MTYQSQHILDRFMAGDLSPQERLEAIWPAQPDTSLMLVACAPHHYSASAVAKGVEDCDVQLKGLSVTAMRTLDGWPVVALSVESRTVEGIERSLARYGFQTLFALTPDGGADDPQRLRAMERINELIHYLEI